MKWLQTILCLIPVTVIQAHQVSFPDATSLTSSFEVVSSSFTSATPVTPVLAIPSTDVTSSVQTSDSSVITSATTFSSTSSLVIPSNSAGSSVTEIPSASIDLNLLLPTVQLTLERLEPVSPILPNENTNIISVSSSDMFLKPTSLSQFPVTTFTQSMVSNEFNSRILSRNRPLTPMPILVAQTRIPPNSVELSATSVSPTSIASDSILSSLSTVNPTQIDSTEIALQSLTKQQENSQEIPTAFPVTATSVSPAPLPDNIDGISPTVTLGSLSNTASLVISASIQDNRNSQSKPPTEIPGISSSDDALNGIETENKLMPELIRESILPSMEEDIQHLDNQEFIDAVESEGVIEGSLQMSNCVTPLGEKGRCVHVKGCPGYSSLIDYIREDFVVKYFRGRVCRVLPKAILFCCPENPILPSLPSERNR